MVSVVWFTLGLTAAWPMKVHGLGGSPPPVLHHSWVVLLNPIESSTYFPVGLGTPLMSRGVTAAAWASPTAACAAGMLFDPPGYSPPWYWLRYCPLPRSLSGKNPVLAANALGPINRTAKARSEQRTAPPRME